MSLDNLTAEQLRKLDATLAEKVMGFVKNKYGEWCVPSTNIPTGRPTLLPMYASKDDEHPDSPYFRPTTDPAAALGLLEKYTTVKMEKLHVMSYWYVYLYLDFDHMGQASASTLPLSICAAVMAAEGLEVLVDG